MTTAGAISWDGVNGASADITRSISHSAAFGTRPVSVGSGSVNSQNPGGAHGSKVASTGAKILGDTVGNTHMKLSAIIKAGDR